jgi:hypothetical protein
MRKLCRTRIAGDKAAGILGLVAAGVCVVLAARTLRAEDAPAVPSREGEVAALRKMLGNGLERAKIVAKSSIAAEGKSMRAGSRLAVIELETLEVAWHREFSLERAEGKYAFYGLSQPSWSPDAEHVAFSLGKSCYILRPGTDELRKLDTADVSIAVKPLFWQDAKTGELCVVFSDLDAKVRYPHHEGEGSTWLYRLGSGKTEELFGYPCDGGLSRDGTHLGTAWSTVLLAEVTTGEVHVLNDGHQGCCASVAPDNSYRLIHNTRWHDRFKVRNKYDLLLQEIFPVEDAHMIMTPRWSNHPDIIAYVVQLGADGGPYQPGRPWAYKLALYNLKTKQKVILRSVPGSWYGPHLWMPVTEDDLRTPGPIDDLHLDRLAEYKARIAEAPSYVPIVEELKKMPDNTEAQRIVAALEEYGRNRLKIAAEARDALRGRSVYRELRDKFGSHPIGQQAAEALESASFKREVGAANVLHELERARDGLRNVEGAKARFDDPAYFRRNRPNLVTMAKLAAELRKDHEGTRAAKQAEAIVAEHALPAQSWGTGNVNLVINATIEAVSTIPRPEDIAPYRNAVVYVCYKVDRVRYGEYDRDTIIVVHWGLRDRQPTPVAEWQPGKKLQLKLDRFDAHQELEVYPAGQDAWSDLDMEPYWAREVTPLR